MDFKRNKSKFITMRINCRQLGCPAMVLSNCAKIAVSALLAGAAFSNAANIIQDDFSTNPSNPNSVGWYSSSAGFSTFSAASGGLQFTSNTATTNQSVFKQFTPTSLA